MMVHEFTVERKGGRRETPICAGLSSKPPAPQTSGCRKDLRQRSGGSPCYQREGGLGPRQPSSLRKRTPFPHHCRTYQLIYDSQRESISPHTSVTQALAGAARAAGGGGSRGLALPPPVPPAAGPALAGPRPRPPGLDRIRPPWDGRARTRPAGSRAGASAAPV